MESRLDIDRLRLALPPEYASRAGAIGRHLAAALARMPVSGTGRIARIWVPALTAHPGDSDAVLAGRIARAIHTEIGRALAHQTPVASARPPR